MRGDSATVSVAVTQGGAVLRESGLSGANEALAHGARCEGPPGLRPEYHAHYYGAYFRDSEGNKLCVACHTPAELP